MYVSMYVCMYVFMYECRYVYVCKYVGLATKMIIFYTVYGIVCCHDYFCAEGQHSAIHPHSSK